MLFIRHWEQNEMIINKKTNLFGSPSGLLHSSIELLDSISGILLSICRNLFVGNLVSTAKNRILRITQLFYLIQSCKVCDITAFGLYCVFISCFDIPLTDGVMLSVKIILCRNNAAVLFTQILP